MAERKRPTVTETVAVLDGEKVLVIKVDGEVRAVQNRAAVDQRIESVGKVIGIIDIGLAMSDAEHLAAATKRLDEQIGNMQKRKASLTAEGVAAAAKARLQEKRLALSAQRDALADAVAEMSADAPEAPAPSETPTAP